MAHAQGLLEQHLDLIPLRLAPACFGINVALNWWETGGLSFLGEVCVGTCSMMSLHIFLGAIASFLGHSLVRAQMAAGLAFQEGVNVGHSHRTLFVKGSSWCYMLMGGEKLLPPLQNL